MHHVDAAKKKNQINAINNYANMKPHITVYIYRDDDKVVLLWESAEINTGQWMSVEHTSEISRNKKPKHCDV